jgi:hypothetical protein
MRARNFYLTTLSSSTAHFVIGKMRFLVVCQLRNKREKFAISEINFAIGKEKTLCDTFIFV